ncbi:PREDICTED: uncharacterized protein LOC105452176 [Wasmannia auropunctata]|uniref:uncharacterized protein LOC105452176 n=1 Tax=Wasmannia auropunctata TaxID=64793 RepID=UPI0005EF01CB|nr:PREDICTED: uncharacterized protein LOC105452176 [Wasmannia auropunctata]
MTVAMRRLLPTAAAVCCWLLALSVAQVAGQLLDTEFQPTVTATCKGGYMTIRVNLNQSFVGAVHARDHRTPQCMVSGNGTTHATLGINLFASQDSPEYCGVLVNNHTEERSIPIAVRIHKTLELADDKFYVITCGKAGFKNAKFSIRVLFNKLNSSVQLIDDKGCPVKVRMTKFIYDRSTGKADATLLSMFRFADSSEVHFQCDIAVCRGSCGTPVCEGDKEELIKGGSSTNSQSVSSEEGVLLAGTSVFVLQPGEKRVVQTLYDDGSVHPLWLLWLAVALGILFLIMLIINIFLCSAMTCSCTRTDIIEKEPSIIEDYDPYRSWHGSQYGSRYSLNGKQGYASGGSTMNSTRSISTNSDHYAIVHSRPGSRYSGPGQKHHHHHRGPPSNIGSHYSGK